MGQASCLMVALGLVLIPLRSWRHPLRPRDDLLEPGMAASYATAMAVAVSTILNLTHSIMERSLRRIAPLEIFNSASHQHRTLIPWAVLGAWLALAAMGHWRPANFWIERMGRVVAMYWCLYPVLEATASLIVRVLPRSCIEEVNVPSIRGPAALQSIALVIAGVHSLAGGGMDRPFVHTVCHNSRPALPGFIGVVLGGAALCGPSGRAFRREPRSLGGVAAGAERVNS